MAPTAARTPASLAKYFRPVDRYARTASSTGSSVLISVTTDRRMRLMFAVARPISSRRTKKLSTYNMAAAIC